MASQLLVGDKRGLITGGKLYVSPAVGELLRGPEAWDVLASLDIVEASPAEVQRLTAESSLPKT